MPTTKTKRRSPRPHHDGFSFEASEAVAHLRDADRKLAALIDDVGPFAMTLQSVPSVFGALAEAIVYQQLTGKAAATIFGRVKALFPESSEAPNPADLLRLSEEALRGAGLSRAKFLALRDLAEKTEAGLVPTLDEVASMDDAEIIMRLTEVRGVGRWTAEMLLMFRLGRPDVLPVDDYGVRKGFAIAFKKKELPAPKALLAYGERWRPYRTVASWYLWRAVDRARAKPATTVPMAAEAAVSPKKLATKKRPTRTTNR